LQGHTLVIVTATNRFLTEPIAGLFGVKNLIASEAEQVDGIYTGQPSGIPSYREGKVARLENWLDDNNLAAEESWFYSDSHNDIPLLEYVDHATAVDPDDQLRETANRRGWPIISLRD
ncbi:MAG: HAD-IB family phosphatase, partial [Gammaproteobacteria bacterium]|nr:HAD-IB family phosphatase [Gammaproteobacteria bacterium]